MKWLTLTTSVALAMASPLSLVLTLGTPAAARDLQFFLNPKINGEYVWPCSYADRFSSACSIETVQYVADEFCYYQGYSGSIEYYTLPRDQQREYLSVQVWTETQTSNGLEVGWQSQAEKLNRFTGIECYN